MLFIEIVYSKILYTKFSGVQKKCNVSMLLQYSFYLAWVNSDGKSPIHL